MADTTDEWFNPAEPMSTEEPSAEPAFIPEEPIAIETTEAALDAAPSPEAASSTSTLTQTTGSAHVSLGSRRRPKSRPWRPPGVSCADAAGGHSPQPTARSSSTGALRSERERDRVSEQLHRAPAFRTLPQPELRAAGYEVRVLNGEAPKEEPQVSPQSATTASASAYWGLGSPSNPGRPDSPMSTQFPYLPIHQLRQQALAREEELECTKMRVAALRQMLQQQLEERKKTKALADELTKLSAKHQEALASNEETQATLEKERQHLKALRQEVRRLRPKWRRPDSGSPRKQATFKPVSQAAPIRRRASSASQLTSVKDAPKEAPNASKDPRRGSAKELLKEAGPIARASTQGTSKESNGTPRESSPRHSKLGTPRESAKGTPRASIKDTPKESTKGSPRESTKGIPKETASLKAAEMKDTEKRCKSPRRSLSQRLPVESRSEEAAEKNVENSPRRFSAVLSGEGNASSPHRRDEKALPQRPRQEGRSSSSGALRANVSSVSQFGQCGAGPLPPSEGASPLDSLDSRAKHSLDLQETPPSAQSTLTTRPQEHFTWQEQPVLVTRKAGMKEAALPMPVEPLSQPMEPLTARSNPPSRRESRPERAGDAPTLLSRCHALAASRTLCEEAAQRARKLQASLMEAQWREAAVMRELSIKQQELDWPCHKPLCRSTSAGGIRSL